MQAELKIGAPARALSHLILCAHLQNSEATLNLSFNYNSIHNSSQHTQACPVARRNRNGIKRVSSTHVHRGRHDII
ncbi:hypothetical protein BOTBODRAFT_474195 [Botryobasidium botryosum FD-172 SS1]|uniref:Uncharacterized protein n=1 Tax=Botryobasidium botryosum (strain FD-172 SS1) TaxID=930990 RepID=A0A067M506_BOTB1|nr:hypothetical protein BOTBODRAFT_474195 [Botryobasidium botryosum FD-172 SS1]